MKKQRKQRKMLTSPKLKKYLETFYSDEKKYKILGKTVKNQVNGIMIKTLCKSENNASKLIK